jgi:hypothetical protein
MKQSMRDSLDFSQPMYLIKNFRCCLVSSKSEVAEERGGETIKNCIISFETFFVIFGFS